MSLAGRVAIVTGSSRGIGRVIALALAREGEGEPYTGLKPAGTDPGAGIAEADRALDKNSVDDLVQSMTARVTAGIRERYTRAVERKTHAEESVQAGREYVEAYVAFIHYVEQLQEDVTRSASHHGAPGSPETRRETEGERLP